MSMDTARLRRCQFVGAAALICWTSLARGGAVAPGWQNELNALRLLSSAAGADESKQAAIARTFRDLAAKYPASAEIQKACGDYLWNSNAPDDALPFWRAAQALAPDDAELASSLGGAFLRLARTREAAAQFARAAAAAPDNAYFHFQRATTLELFRHELDGEQSLVTALSEYRRAAELAPGDRRLAQAYAETFYVLAQPDWERALDAWLTVRKSSGDAPDFANVHLARISLNLGRPEAARAYLDQLTNPAFNPVRDKLRARANQLQRNSSSNPSK